MDSAVLSMGTFVPAFRWTMVDVLPSFLRDLGAVLRAMQQLHAAPCLQSQLGFNPEIISALRKGKVDSNERRIPQVSKSDISEGIWSATDASRASGKPLGNVALPGILV